jgi:FIMAH domain-containing protein
MTIKALVLAAVLAASMASMASTAWASSTTTIDPAAYTGRYVIGGIVYTGPQTLTLAAGPYSIDTGAEVGGSSFTFTVDDAGNVGGVSNPASASASGNTLRFNTASVNIAPAAYTGRYILTSHYPTPFTGALTVALVPGLVYGVDDGTEVGGSEFLFTVDASGQVSTTSPSATTSGSTLTFKNTSVTIDPAKYTGLYFPSSHAPTAFTGMQTLVLVPGLVYGIDNGSEVGGSGFPFSVDLTGSVSSTSTSATGSGSTLTFANVLVWTDPNGYTGTYRIGGVQGLSGAAGAVLIPGLVAALVALDQVAYITVGATAVTPSSVTLEIGGAARTFTFSAVSSTSSGASPIAPLTQQVQALPLSGGTTQSLVASLNAASRLSAAGSTTQATKLLNVFIGQVQRLVASGQLSAAAGNTLIGETKALIGFSF